MTFEQTALTAAKGADTEDLLDHIAWTDVVLPKFLADREFLTKKLVDMTLAPIAPGSETKEQVAGKIYGIDYAIKTLEKIVKDGKSAKQTLAANNISLST